MPHRNSVKTIDANILLDYILQHNLSDRDKRNKITSMFNHANTGNEQIRVFVYSMGEVFKRLIEQRDGHSVDLSVADIQRCLRNVQGWVRDGFIVTVKFEEVSYIFEQHYRKVDRMDSLIQKGDKIALAAFCSDTESKTFYSFDRNINQSVKLQDYVRGMGKAIKEP